MPLRFTVLASGSSGNASLVEADGFGVLIDAGLGPRLLSSRLAAFGASWNRIQAVLLTHTHHDHWNERTIAHLTRRRIPLYCHPNHHETLSTFCPSFAGLKDEHLVHGYEAEQEVILTPGLRCRPFPVRHDSGATFGFRFENSEEIADPAVVLAYAADLGSWTAELVHHLADVDLLALEFNHDEEMEKQSGRAPELIARVLGEEGHLSNAQAAELLREVLLRSEPGRLEHVVQLHLSRHCNLPALAAQAARAVLADGHENVTVHSAKQYDAGPCLTLAAPAKMKTAEPARLGDEARATPVLSCRQQMLPGWE